MTKAQPRILIKATQHLGGDASRAPKIYPEEAAHRIAEYAQGALPSAHPIVKVVVAAVVVSVVAAVAVVVAAVPPLASIMGRRRHDRHGHQHCHH